MSGVEIRPQASKKGILTICHLVEEGEESIVSISLVGLLTTINYCFAFKLL